MNVRDKVAYDTLCDKVKWLLLTLGNIPLCYSSIKKIEILGFLFFIIFARNESFLKDFGQVNEIPEYKTS